MTDQEETILLDHIENLKNKCNRYPNSFCLSKNCLDAGGGFIKGLPFPDCYNNATCDTHKVIQVLEKIVK